MDEGHVTYTSVKNVSVFKIHKHLQWVTIQYDHYRRT